MLVGIVLAGCQQTDRVASAQRPGYSSGAGATFVGPTNSAAPSKHTATKTTVYAKPPPAQPPPPTPRPAVAQAPVAGPLLEPATPTTEDPVVLTATEQPTLAWTTESTTTELGEHQDLSSIVKAAKRAEGWNSTQLVGLLALVVGVLGYFWSLGNKDGYPLVFLKVGGIGLYLMLVGGNPLWLFLLVIPVGFWALQHTNLLRFPAP